MIDLGINYGQPVNWSHPLNRGLLGWWLPLPNWAGGLSLRDLCGVRHGTLTSMEPTDWWTGPRVGNWPCALDFETNDYVRINAPRVSSAGTILAWAALDVENSAHQILSYCNSTRGQFDKVLGTHDTGSGLFAPCCMIFDGATKRVVGTTNFFASAGGTYPRVGLWGMTWDSTTLRLYFNGREEGSAAAGASFDGWSNGPFLDVGWGNTGSKSGFWNGRIRDVRVYGRALSASEMWQYYDLSQRHYLGLLNRSRLWLPGLVDDGGGATTRRYSLTLTGVG